MIRRIRLRNYMSHADTEIELAPGLTVLVGPNNCGKSALVSAIEAVARNQAGDFMVRHGARGCEVEVEVEVEDPQDAPRPPRRHTIAWRRRSAVSYVVDGEEYARVRTSVPEAAEKLLRMPLVEGEGGKDLFEVHIARQKEPIFLLGDSGGRAASFFAASTESSRLLEMQRRHRDEVADRRREHGRLEGAIELVRRESEALLPMASVERALERLEAERRTLEDGEARARALEPLLARLGALERRCAALRGRRALLARLESPPVPLVEAPLESAVVRCGAISRSLARAAEARRVLRALAPPPPAGPEEDLAARVRALGELVLRARIAGSRSTALSRLEPPPRLEAEEPLGAEVERLEGRMAALDRGRSIGRVFARLDRVGPRALEPARLREIELGARLEALVSAVEAAARGQVSVRRAEADVASQRAALNAYAAAHPTCPLCGGAVVLERLLDAHAGARPVAHAHLLSRAIES